MKRGIFYKKIRKVSQLREFKISEALN